MKMIETRTILVRADSVKDARRFANLSHKRLSTNEYLPEKVISVKLNRSAGLAGGVKGYNVRLRRKRDTRRRINGLLV